MAKGHDMRLSHWPRTFITFTYDNEGFIFSNFLIQCCSIIRVTLCIWHYILVEINLQFWCITIKLLSYYILFVDCLVFKV